MTELPRMSRPAARALAAAGIASLEELAQRTEADVLALHGMGAKGVALLKDALARQGLGFRPG